MLSVRELVQDLDVRVVAGEAGLDASVRWVHISELADPTPWLSGGELLLTTGMQLAGQEREFVAKLAEHGLAGIGVGVGLGLDAVPAAMREEAEQRGLPLLEVPYELPFIAITERAASVIVNEHYATLQRAISAHVRLERVVLSEGGLEGLAGALGELVGGTVAILDGRGEVLAQHGPGPSGDDALRLPVSRGADAIPQAWLAAARDGAPLTELDRLILHQAVTIVALELLRRRVAEDTERRLAGDVLASLLGGELQGAELQRRLEPFGLRKRVAALVLQPPRALHATVETALARAVQDAAGGGLVANAGAFACALLPAAEGEDDDALFARAESIRDQVGREAGVDLPAGAGRPAGPGDARRTFHEARCALEARRLANGNGGPLLATYRDLGSFQLLLSLQDDEALALFCDSILSPIEDGEGAYGGELMRSLEVFIECNGQWERAARQLFCHRHTLRYRIRRIEELTGRSLDSARDRIDFWLALRGRELLA